MGHWRSVCWKYTHLTVPVHFCFYLVTIHALQQHRFIRASHGAAGCSTWHVLIKSSGQVWLKVCLISHLSLVLWGRRRWSHLLFQDLMISSNWLCDFWKVRRLVLSGTKVDEGVGERGGGEVLHCAVSTFSTLHSHLPLQHTELDFFTELLSTNRETVQNVIGRRASLWLLSKTFLTFWSFYTLLEFLPPVTCVFNANTAWALRLSSFPSNHAQKLSIVSTRRTESFINHS